MHNKHRIGVRESEVTCYHDITESLKTDHLVALSAAILFKSQTARDARAAP